MLTTVLHTHQSENAMPLSAENTERARLHVRAASDALDRNTTTSREHLSIGRLMRSMVAAATPSPADLNWAKAIREDEAAAEWAAAFGNAARLTAAPHLQGTGGRFAAQFGPRDCALIDWQWLRAESRAMATTLGSKGGYAIGNEVLPLLGDPLWQDSLIGVGGVQIIEGLSNNVTIPRASSVTASWQAGDGTAPSAVDPPLGLAELTARAVIATVQCSVQLARQAATVNDFLARLLLRSLRQALDKALLQGSGASGEPQGLATLPTSTGIQQVSGTSLAWAGILDAQDKVSSSGVTDSRTLWVGPSSVRKLIATRERTSGSGRTLWDDGKIEGQPALATPDAPASTLFVGDFSTAVLGLYGPGIELRFDPNNNYAAGLVAFQVLAICDIAFPQPSAFARITSIT